MKILAFVDLHADLTSFRYLEQLCKKEKPDVVVCAGDFTIFERFIEEMMFKISCLCSRVFVIHGNHETAEVVEKLCSRYKSTIFLHKKCVDFKGLTFVGYGGGGFDMVDKGFEMFFKSINLRNNNVVLITHAPPFGTEIDLLGKHYGNKSYAKFISENKNVILNICGHFHETAGKKDKLNSAIVINPGKRGVIVEVE